MMKTIFSYVHLHIFMRCTFGADLHLIIRWFSSLIALIYSTSIQYWLLWHKLIYKENIIQRLTSFSMPLKLSSEKETWWLFTPIFSGSTRLLESQLTEPPCGWRSLKLIYKPSLCFYISNNTVSGKEMLHCLTQKKQVCRSYVIFY